MRQHPVILFKDEHIIAVNKPAELLVLPDRFDKDKICLLSLLKRRFDPLFVVHRLDRDTSGMIIFARNEIAHKSLNLLFENRMIEKKYLCLTDGQWSSDCTVEIGIEKATGLNLMRASEKGKEARTHFKVVERFNKWTLLEVSIETGRTHQIRVHAQYMGHPIVSDPIYNSGKALGIFDIKSKAKGSHTDSRNLISRTALHAQSLTLVHPITAETLSLSAPLPKDMKATINQLRKWATIH